MSCLVCFCTSTSRSPIPGHLTALPVVRYEGRLEPCLRIRKGDVICNATVTSFLPPSISTPGGARVEHTARCTPAAHFSPTHPPFFSNMQPNFLQPISILPAFTGLCVSSTIHPLYKWSKLQLSTSWPSHAASVEFSHPRIAA